MQEAKKQVKIKKQNFYLNFKDSLMLPFNWKEMIDPESGLKELRKVAMPDFSYFSENN